MKGFKLKVEKNRVTSITDEDDNKIDWVQHVQITLDHAELPRVYLELTPECVDIEMVDSILLPEFDDKTLKQIAALRGYNLVPRCDDDTNDVTIEQELHSADQDQRLPITRVGGHGSQGFHSGDGTLERRQDRAGPSISRGVLRQTRGSLHPSRRGDHKG